MQRVSPAESENLQIFFSNQVGLLIKRSFEEVISPAVVNAGEKKTIPTKWYVK